MAHPSDVTLTGESQVPDPRWTRVLRWLGEAERERGDKLRRQALEKLASCKEPDRYAIEQEIARGGQGMVLRVWDGAMSRRLAMKRMLSKDGALAPDLNSRGLSRFLTEIQVTGQLDHPGIVPVHEMGVDEEGKPFFTMKLVEGESLASIFHKLYDKGTSWSRTRALGVCLRVCEAVAYAHSKGVIHRDLKPANIMVGRFGEVYVMDWGLAKVLSVEGSGSEFDRPVADLDPILDEGMERDSEETREPSFSRTSDGRIVGTVWYMAPEQANGEADLGPEADIYSIGAILYELLVGHPPYDNYAKRLSPRAVLTALLSGPATPIHRLQANVPADLVGICERAMAWDRDERYSEVLSLAEDLRAHLESPRPRQTTRMRIDGGQRGRSRGTRSAFSLALKLVFGMALFGIFLFAKMRADGRSEELERELLRVERDLKDTQEEKRTQEEHFERTGELARVLRDTLKSYRFPSFESSEHVPRTDLWLPPLTKIEAPVPKPEASERDLLFHLEQAVLREPDRSDLRVQLALVRVDQRDYSKALEILDNPLQDPSLAYLTLRGHCQRALGEWAKAVQAYEEALRHYPQEHELHFDIGGVHLAAQDWPRAIERLILYSDLRPDSERSLELLGLALLEEGRMEEAEEILRKAVRKSPESPTAHWRLAQSYVGLGQGLAAMHSLRAALHFGQELPAQQRRQLQRELGTLLLRQGNAQEALAALERSFEPGPYDAAWTSIDQLDHLLIELFFANPLQSGYGVQLELARSLVLRGLNASAVHLYADLFRKVGSDEDPTAGHRFLAAQAALMESERVREGSERLVNLARRWIEEGYVRLLRSLEFKRISSDAVKAELLHWKLAPELESLRDQGGEPWGEIEHWLASH